MIIPIQDGVFCGTQESKMAGLTQQHWDNILILVKNIADERGININTSSGLDIIREFYIDFSDEETVRIRVEDAELLSLENQDADLTTTQIDVRQRIADINAQRNPGPPAGPPGPP